MKRNPYVNWLLVAIKIIGGTNTEIAQKLGISVQRLDGWLNKRVAIPFEFALILESLTDGQVKAEDLSPEKMLPLKRLGIQVHLSRINDFQSTESGKIYEQIR